MEYLLKLSVKLKHIFSIFKLYGCSMNNVFRFFVINTFVVIQLQAQTRIPVFIPSEAAGTTGIAAQITIPVKARYGTSAPVVIHLLGGFSAGDITFGVDMAQYGFIEIRFLYPGGSDTIDGKLTRSGGVYDTRGIQCLRALRDILKFAMELQADVQGKKLGDYSGMIRPLRANVGLYGSSNGGNSTITVAGIFGAEISELAWIVNWESPVGDGVANAEAGSKQAGLNPAYNTSNNTYDYTKLKYSDTLSAGMILQGIGKPVLTLRGGLYFDMNGNGFVDTGDFPLSPRADTVEGKTRAYFSNATLEAAYNANLFPTARPTHISTLQENRDYWKYRNGEGWFESAVRALPKLLFTVVASVEDHVQIAPNYPHIVIQYDGFRKAGARFVRLNADRVYTEFALGRSTSNAADNDANAVFDFGNIKTGLQPSGAGPNGLRSDVTIIGALLEIADRTQTNTLTANLQAVISVPTGLTVKTETPEFTVYPNPIQNVVNIHFSLQEPERVCLKIVNSLGQEIITLINEVCQKGEHQLQWNIPSHNSGVLYCILRTTSFSEMKVIQVMR